MHKIYQFICNFWQCGIFCFSFDPIVCDNLNINRLALILKIISQCGANHLLMLQIKTITSVLKVLTYIITSITACPISLTVILVIMSVSTFRTDIILYRYISPIILLKNINFTVTVYNLNVGFFSFLIINIVILRFKTISHA